MAGLPTRSRRWGAAVAVSVMALLLSGCMNAWPQFRYGPARTSFNPDETTLTPANVSTLTSKWEQTLPSTSPTNNKQGETAAVAEGLVFVATGDAVYALDETTGSTTWSYPVSQPTDPVYDNGKVFFSTLDRHVYALTASSGALVWRVPTLAVPSTPQQLQGEVTVFAGKVYFVGSDTRMYALDEQTGKQVTSFELAEPGWVAIDPATGDIYVVQEPGLPPCCLIPPVIDAYSPSGDLLWVESLGVDGRQTAPVIDGGRVYVGSQAFDAATGAPVWSNSGAPAVDAAADGMVFGISGLSLIASDAATGQELWTTQVGTPSGDPSIENTEVQGPVVANGVLYVEADNTIKAVDEHTGALLATVVSPRPLDQFEAPVVAGGQVFFVGFASGGIGVDTFGLP